MNAYGWADLDTMNKADGHYERKPVELRQAFEDMEIAWSDYDRAVDAFYDRGNGSLDEISNRRKYAESKTAEYKTTYERIYGQSEQETPIGQQLDGFDEIF